MAPAAVLGTGDHAPRRIGLTRLWRIAADHGGMPPAVLGAAPQYTAAPGGARCQAETDPELDRLVGVLVRPVLAVEVRSFARGRSGPTIVRRATAVRDSAGHTVGAVRDGADDRCEVTSVSWPPVAELGRWLGAAQPADLPGGRWPTAALVAAIGAAGEEPPSSADPAIGALAAAERHTEIAVVRGGRIEPAALVVYDSGAGRIVAVPSTAGDGVPWTSIGPGTPARIAGGLRRIVAGQPPDPLISPAGP